MNNFNLIAPVYDRLAELAFNKAVRDADCNFVDEITEEDTVLILGGGTGRILEQLPRCKEVTYLDKSSKMVEIAKKRACLNPIRFIRADFLDHTLDNQYSVLVCSFFLDCFSDKNLNTVLTKIKRTLKTDGRLMVADFQSNTPVFLIMAMHLFFKVFASLESRSLKNIHEKLLEMSFLMENEAFFHKNQIFSRIYRNL